MKTGWTLKNIRTGELSGFSPESPTEWDGGEVPVPVVMVEIPEATADGLCNPECPFAVVMAREIAGCNLCFDIPSRDDMCEQSPGPDCPEGRVKP